jgi:hypothetical protein
LCSEDIFLLSSAVVARTGVGRREAQIPKVLRRGLSQQRGEESGARLALRDVENVFSLP